MIRTIIRRHALACAALLSLGCAMELDGEVGVTTLAVVNESDQALELTYEAGGRGEPDLLASSVPAGESVDVLRMGVCFGCADPPSGILRRFTITRASDEAVVLALDPVADSDWTQSATTPSGGTYDAHHSVTVTQAQVDAAAP